MRPSPLPLVPESTAAVARAAFGEGNRCVRLRDELGALYEDADFAALFPARGRRALPPWRLALVTVLQFLEHRSDRQATEAVRSRTDWTYALALRMVRVRGAGPHLVQHIASVALDYREGRFAGANDVPVRKRGQRHVGRRVRSAGRPVRRPTSQLRTRRGAPRGLRRGGEPLHHRDVQATAGPSWILPGAELP